MQTKEPVTTGGWYELTDGRVQRFDWVKGRAHAHEIVASWADVRTESDRVEDMIAADNASPRTYVR
jgi:hypothetical protein